jgi:zinc protease
MVGATIGSMSSPRFPVEHWRLANGLRVIVQVDARCPLVASMMCYDAGSRHDPPSRSGLAHFCEHLAFEGPRGAARGSGSVGIDSLGGAARAVTTTDRLCFSTLVPSGELGEVLAVEAERMARPPAPRDDEALEIHRRVLMRELRERSQARLRAVAFEQIHRLIFPEGHPYHRPPAGELDGIGAITAEDVRAFSTLHVTPRNALLVLVGDVSVTAAAELVTNTFGVLPAGAERPPEAACEENPLTGPRSLRVPAPVSGAHAYAAWPVAGFAQPDWYIASLLVRGLATGRSSSLAQELVERTGLACEVHGHLVSMRDASTLVFGATAARGVASGRLEQGLVEATDRLLASGLSVEELARARKKALSDHYFVVQSLERRADRCGSLGCFRDAPERLHGEAERYLDPDRHAVALFASRLGKQAARATVSLIPAAEAA